MYAEADYEGPVFVGPPLGEGQMEALRGEGIRSVLSLAPAIGAGGGTSPLPERNRAEGLGMEYQHLPIARENVSARQVDTFRDELARMPKPVYVHAGDAALAGAFLAMAQGIRLGLSSSETLSRAGEFGFDGADESLKQFVSDYIRNRAGA